MCRDNALTELRKKFKKAEKERDDLKLTFEKFKNSSKNLGKLLDSQVCDKFKTGVGFDSQVIDSQVNDRYKIGEGYHAVPPPYTGNFMPPKPDLILVDVDEYVVSETVTSVPAVAINEAKTSESKPKSGKDFSGRVTPLFPTMIVQAQEELEVVTDEAVYEEMYDNVKRVSTTATGLDAEQDRGIINKTQFTAKLNEPSSIRTSSGSGLRRQEIIGDAAAQTRVLALKTKKTNQALEIEILKRKLKKLEKKASKRTRKLKRLYKIGFSKRIESLDEASLGDQEDASKQGRIIDNLDADEGVTLVDETQGRNDQDMFDTCVLDEEEVVGSF
nr:hypothetical protein [Tanacetum cinerariifolium]